MVSVFDCGGEGVVTAVQVFKVWDEDLHQPQGLPCYYKIKPTWNSKSTETIQLELPCKNQTRLRTALNQFSEISDETQYHSL